MIGLSQLAVSLLVGTAACVQDAYIVDEPTGIDLDVHNHTVKRGWTEIKHLFVFGDSYTTTSWDPWGALPSDQNPLGNPAFPGHNLCNCRSWTSLLSTEFSAAPTRTYNFARNCASIANVGTSRCNDPNIRNMEDQLNDWDNFLTRLRNADPASFNYISSANSLFVSWMGINDVHWLSQYSDHDAEVNIDILMDIYSRFLDTLYNRGARNFLILGMPRIDFTPMVFLQKNGARSTMAKKLRTLQTFNWKLTGRVQAWRGLHPDAKLVLVDTDPMTARMAEHPEIVGADPNSGMCIDRREDGSCLWADDFHPSGRVHHEIARQVSNRVNDDGLYGFFRRG